MNLSTVDDSLYFMCNIEDFKFLADMIQHVPLPLRVRYLFCCAPINKKMPFVCTMFLKVLLYPCYIVLRVQNYHIYHISSLSSQGSTVKTKRLHSIGCAGTSVGLYSLPKP